MHAHLFGVLLCCTRQQIRCFLCTGMRNFYKSKPKPLAVIDGDIDQLSRDSGAAKRGKRVDENEEEERERDTHTHTERAIARRPYWPLHSRGYRSIALAYPQWSDHSGVLRLQSATLYVSLQRMYCITGPLFIPLFIVNQVHFGDVYHHCSHVV